MSKAKKPILTRATIIERFADGHWWTIDGMAAHLTDVIPQHVAARHVMDMPRLAALPEIQRAVAGRRRAVQVTVQAMVSDNLAETMQEHGVTKFKIRPRAFPTAAEDNTSGKPEYLVKSTTQIGIGVYNVEAALKACGGEASVATLIAMLLPVLAPPAVLVPLWLNNSGAKAKTPEENTQAAQRWAVMTVLQHLKQTGRSSHRAVMYVKLKT